LNKNSFYAVILLAAVWVILRESFTVLTVAGGIAAGFGCVYFCSKFFPPSKSSAIDPFKFAGYLLFLIGQIYVAGIFAIKLILTDAQVEVVEMKTEVTDFFLRTVLVNSITLVPGSVALDLSGDTITVLWLKKKTDDPEYLSRADEMIKGKLERRLLKIQK